MNERIKKYISDIKWFDEINQMMSQRKVIKK